MPKINGIDYPDTFYEVMKDKNLKPMLLKQIAKNRDQPIAAHALQKSNFHPKEYYEEFFAPNAKYQLRHFIGNVHGAAERLAEAKAWDKIGSWKKVYEAAQRQSTLQLDGVDVVGLYNRDDFLKYHKAKLEKEITIPPAVMKHLGITDKKGAAQMLAAIQMGETVDAEKIADKVIKKEKLKQAPREFIKAMRKMLKI